MDRKLFKALFNIENQRYKQTYNGIESSFESSFQETPDLRPQKIDLMQDQLGPSQFDQFSTDFSNPSNPSIINHIQAMSILTNNQSSQSNRGQSHNFTQDVNLIDLPVQNYTVLEPPTQTHLNLKHLPPLPTSSNGNNLSQSRQQNKIINESILSSQHHLSGNSNNQTRNQSGSIMMESMSVIQKNRANLLNGSNNQSIRETIISSSQNQVSEIPTEYKSISDIHEVLEVQETSFKIDDDRKLKSQLELSKVKNIKATSTTGIMKQEGRANLAQNFLPRNSVKSIRQTPQFKGIGSVLQTSSTKNATSKKQIFAEPRYCETQVENLSLRLHESISTSSFQRAMILNTTQNLNDLRVKPQNSPLVITSKDKPNVYRIIGRDQSVDQRLKQSRIKNPLQQQQQQISITPKNPVLNKHLLIDANNFQGRQSTCVKNLKNYQNDENSIHSSILKPRNQLFNTANLNLQSALLSQNGDYQHIRKNQNCYPLNGFMTAHQSPKAFFDKTLSYSIQQKFFDPSTSLRISTQQNTQANQNSQQIRGKQNILFQPQYLDQSENDYQKQDRVNTEPVRSNNLRQSSDLNEGVIYVNGGVGQQQQQQKQQQRQQHQQVRFEDQRQNFGRKPSISSHSRYKEQDKKQRAQYFDTDPVVQQIKNQSSARKSQLEQQEKYLKALKQRQLGDGLQEPGFSSSECEDDEDDEDILASGNHFQRFKEQHSHQNEAPKIFFTQERQTITYKQQNTSSGISTSKITDKIIKPATDRNNNLENPQLSFTRSVTITGGPSNTQKNKQQNLDNDSHIENFSQKIYRGRTITETQQQEKQRMTGLKRGLDEDGNKCIIM
eukprot:403335706